MSSYQKSPQVSKDYQSVQKSYDASQNFKGIRQQTKHHNTYVDGINKKERNNQNIDQQIQSRSVNEQQNIRVNSANPRTVNIKQQSQIQNTQQNSNDMKQAILTTTSTFHKVGLQQSYSPLNQQQSTTASSQLQYSGIYNKSQISQAIPLISQLLYDTQVSQIQQTNKQQHDNLQKKNLDEEQRNNQIFTTPQKNKEQLRQNDYSDNKYQGDSAIKEKEQIELEQYSRNNSKQATQKQSRQSSLDLNHISQISRQEQHKQHLSKPAPLNKHRNTIFPPVNLGDQNESFQDDSVSMNYLQQSAMIESCKMSERNIDSKQNQINRTILSKRLLDLQEPRQNQEEDEEEACQSQQKIRTDIKIGLSQKQIGKPQNQKNESYPENKLKKESSINKQISSSNLGTEREMDIQNLENIEEFSNNQKPPSMSSIHNLQMNHDWNNSKSPKRQNSQVSLKTIDIRSQLSTNNESHLSLHINNKQNSTHPSRQTINSDQLKKALPLTDIQDSENNTLINNRDRKASSTGNIIDYIPDESEKTQIHRTQYMGGNRIPIVKLSQINKNGFYVGDRYFIPQLLKCFKGEKDKLSILYKQYFQKMYSNFQLNLKLQNKYLQISPIFLPNLNSNKKTIFFDLDETLIHCIEIFTDPIQYEQFTQSNLTVKKQSTSRNSESCNEVLCNIQCSPNEQIQCLFSVRPFAKQILQELSKDFELILLTAARKIYADAILEKIDPENKLFSHRFYRECCIEFNIPNPQQQAGTKKSYLKDLRIFQNRKLENVILVDNSPLSYINQMQNGIPILDYCNNNKNDDELLHLCSYLKTLVNVNDVRISIKQKFQLKQYKNFSSIESLQGYLKTEYSDYQN